MRAGSHALRSVAQLGVGQLGGWAMLRQPARPDPPVVKVGIPAKDASSLTTVASRCGGPLSRPSHTFHRWLERPTGPAAKYRHSLSTELVVRPLHGAFGKKSPARGPRHSGFVHGEPRPPLRKTPHRPLCQGTATPSERLCSMRETAISTWAIPGCSLLERGLPQGTRSVQTSHGAQSRKIRASAPIRDGKALSEKVLRSSATLRSGPIHARIVRGSDIVA